jgi:guanylate kinase
MPSEAPKPRGLLIVLCGPSGVGKSTISRRLAEKLHLSYMVSATTRAKKAGDDDKKKYDHISREEFFRRLDNDEFLEYAQNYDEYYGTPKHPALDYLAEGRDVLLEIDVQGALQVRFQYPDALMIFILPPDGPTLLKRLNDRGRDSEEEITKRFRACKREVHMARGCHTFDTMVVNDELESAVDAIVQIIHHERSGGI